MRFTITGWKLGIGRFDCRNTLECDSTISLVITSFPGLYLKLHFIFTAVGQVETSSGQLGMKVEKKETYAA